MNVNLVVQLVKQRKRKFALERIKVIKQKTEKLLKVDFIRKVYYLDWLSNMVMVKKTSGKWRMCVNFTDLNKAFPKDSFPLPSIDRLVDESIDHHVLSFMGAFSGYNQIMMDLID